MKNELVDCLSLLQSSDGKLNARVVPAEQTGAHDST